MSVGFNFLLILLPNFCAGFLPTNELTIGKIFEISCEFSTFTSRSKRSADLPDDDPKATFDYLFPLASVKPEDFKTGSGRSISEPSLSWYLDDIVDLWHEECAERRRIQEEGAAKKERKRRRKRSQIRKQGSSFGDAKAVEDSWTGYLGNLSATWYTYMPPALAPPFAEEREIKYYGGNHEELIEDQTEDEEGKEEEDKDEDSDEDDDSDDGDEETTEDDDDDDPEESSNKKKNKKTTTTTTTAAPTTTTTSAPSGIPNIADQDPNFASYGGDIEYVFPILACTIPYDGEITALGFHGFKGMFLY